MRQLLALLVLAVTVYGIVDCAQADSRTRRGLPLWAWVVLMLLLPGVGAIIWLVLSRMPTGTPRPQTRPVAPDDDPEFLRYLERRNRQGDDTATPDTPIEDAPTPPSANQADDVAPDSAGHQADSADSPTDETSDDQGNERPTA